MNFWSDEAGGRVWAEIEHVFSCLHSGPGLSCLQFFDVVAYCERR